MKKYIPNNIKLKAKIFLRFFSDCYRGNYQKFASSKNKNLPQLKYKNAITQPFLPSSSLKNKIENINIAAAKINRITIQPNEIFSFWRIIGKPDKRNGYKKGRNIIRGVLSEDYGGGLCQLSGIIYHLSILSGLEITERFNHTIDLYTEETRYTPLGSDATVIYGYKDLRIKNNYDFPIQFKMIVYPDYLQAEVHSEQEIQQQELTFEVQQKTNSTEVITKNQNNEVIAHSNYFSSEERIVKSE